MTRTLFTADVTETQAALLGRVLALSEELDHLALTAPDGTVFHACETAVITMGREVQQRLLEDAVARRVESAEKKGRRSASALADARRKTAAPKNADC
jgi:hypothetical protein